MSVKVLVVVLVAIVVAAVLVLFYGALRPAGDVDGAADGVGGGLGWLSPTRTLTIDDLGAACTDAATATIVVPAGSGCGFAVPDRSEITLCAEAPAQVRVEADGDDYPAQQVDERSLDCADPRPVPIYDVGTQLTVRCVGVAPCAVRVVVPGED